MTVHDWIARLTAVPAASSVLRPLHSTPARRAATAVLGVSIILGLGLWAAFRVASSDRRIGGDAAVTVPAAPGAQDIAPTVAAPGAQDFAPAAVSPIAPAASAVSPNVPAVFAVSPIAPAVSAVSPMAPAVSPPSNTAMARRPGSPADINRISIAADNYKMRSGQKFAEIRVRGSAGSEEDTSFGWWTEPSTAEPGVDYVAQDRITQWLPRGKRVASLFIRLLPNPARTHPAVFYVVIGEPGNDAALGRARTAVELPAK